MLPVQAPYSSFLAEASKGVLIFQRDHVWVLRCFETPIGGVSTLIYNVETEESKCLYLFV